MQLGLCVPYCSSKLCWNGDCDQSADLTRFSACDLMAKINQVMTSHAASGYSDPGRQSRICYISQHDTNVSASLTQILLDCLAPYMSHQDPLLCIPTLHAGIEAMTEEAASLRGRREDVLERGNVLNAWLWYLLG